MKARPVIPRALARADVDDAVDYYLREAGSAAALKFIDMLEVIYRAIGATPAAGSPRYAHELNLPGLRSRRVKQFTYLVFYVERADHIDVWRVLHVQRDIPAWLQVGEG